MGQEMSLNKDQVNQALLMVEGEGTPREPHTRVFAHPAAEGFAYFDVDGNGGMVVSEELMTLILLSAGWVEVPVMPGD